MSEEEVRFKSKLLGLLGFVVFFVAGKFVAEFVTAEREHLNSYSEAWSEDLRVGFVEGCLKESPSEQMPLFASYCPCMARGIEKAGVIPTKYNTMTESEQEIEGRISSLVDSFLESEQGEALVRNCIERAELALQLEAARGGVSQVPRIPSSLSPR